MKNNWHSHIRCTISNFALWTLLPRNARGRHPFRPLYTLLRPGITEIEYALQVEHFNRKIR